METKYLRGALFCLIATMSWGCMFPVMTSALLKMDPFNFTAIRYSTAVLAFIALLVAKEGWGSMSLKGERSILLWLFGTAGFAGFGFLVFLGQQLAGPTGALTASIMMATMPLLSLVVNWALRGVRPPLTSLALVLLSFTGVVIVITKGDIQNLLHAPFSYAANVPLILGALCWVIYTTGASYFPKWSPYRYTALSTLLGLISVFAVTLLLIAVNYIQAPTIPQVISVAPHLLYTALIAGFIGVLSWNLGNKIITPMNGVLFMDIVPLTAFIVSSLTGLVPAGAQIAGACITAIALILNNLYQRRRMIQQASGTVRPPTPVAVR